MGFAEVGHRVQCRLLPPPQGRAQIILNLRKRTPPGRPQKKRGKQANHFVLGVKANGLPRKGETAARDRNSTQGITQGFEALLSPQAPEVPKQKGSVATDERSSSDKDATEAPWKPWKGSVVSRSKCLKKVQCKTCMKMQGMHKWAPPLRTPRSKDRNFSCQSYGLGTGAPYPRRCGRTFPRGYISSQVRIVTPRLLVYKHTYIYMYIYIYMSMYPLHSGL